MHVSKFRYLFVLLVGGAGLFAQGFGGAVPAYDGPAILGRGGPTTGMRGAESVPITLQASVNGTYDTNLIGYSLDSSGRFTQAAGAGVNANIAVTGRKRWSRSFLGLTYTGDYSHFAKQPYFNGSNQQLNLALGKQIGRKWQIASQTGAGTSNRFLGGPNVFQNSEIEFFTAPVTELFDSRSYFIGNTTSATYFLNSRQSIRVAGNGMTVRRKARGLVDMQGYGASSDWVYRLSRRVSTGVSYVFNHYDYSKVFGESDIHTLGWHLSRRIGRDLEIAISLNGAKQSTVGVRSVELDPVIASILGRSSGAVVFESNNLLYGYSGTVTRRVRRSTFSAAAQRAIIPGNGFFLTSINRTVNGSASHSFSRDFSVDANFGYSKLSSLGFTAGDFSGWTGSGGMTYKITDSIGINGRYEWRNLNLSQSTFNRTGNRVTIGLTYFPQQGLAGLF